MKENQGRFVDRVSSIPLIKDGVSTAQALANKTSIGRFALSTANSISEYASKNQPKYLSSYYSSYVQPQVQKADAFGCRSLDLIQAKVPIINKPSSEIIHAVTQPSYEMIDGVKVRIDSTIQTVTHPAHVVVQEANKRFTFVVDNLEGAVDKYLPPSTENGVHNEEKSGNNQVKRAYDVLSVASQRISQKVTDQVSRTIPKSRDDLSRLAESNSLIQELNNKLKLAQDTLAVYSTAALDRLPPSVVLGINQTSEILSQVTETINQQVGHIVNTLKSRSPELPEWLKQNAQNAINTINKQVEQIKTELARTDINYVEKLKHVSTSIQQQIAPILQNVSSQITNYFEIVKEQTPLQYLGVNQKIKTQ